MYKLASLTALLLTIAAGTAGADDATPPATVAHTITILDGDSIHPSALSMRAGDVLEFDNYSAQSMRLVFTEPHDPADKIRCRVAHAQTPGGVAAWQFDGTAPAPQLATIVPPGRSASSCSFAPGRYAFVMRPVARDVRSPADTLGTKAVITVQQ